MRDIVAAATWPTAVLTSAFCPDFPPQRLAMAMCVGYFEAEATTRTFTVCGLVASKARWRQFETQWTRALRHEDLLAFNGRDFENETRDFAAGWRDGSRKRRLIEALSRVAEQHVFRAFSCSMPLDEYHAIDAAYAFRELAGPYGVCAGILMARVRQWMTERRPDDLTVFAFEEGDIDHRELRRITEAERSECGEPPQLWPRRWTDERGRDRFLRPLEACDLFGADARGLLAVRMAERSRVDRQIVDRDRLLRICSGLRIARRTEAGSPRLELSPAAP